MSEVREGVFINGQLSGFGRFLDGNQQYNFMGNFQQNEIEGQTFGQDWIADGFGVLVNITDVVY